MTAPEDDSERSDLSNKRLVQQKTCPTKDLWVEQKTKIVNHVQSPAKIESLDSSAAQGSPYDRIFVLVYLANVTFMLSYSMLFRYSDFVKGYGGQDADLASIIAFASTGSLLARVWLGGLIDRVGARWIWIAATLVWILGLVWHLGLTVSTTWQAYAARLVMQCGMAGFFGASITFISLRVGVNRVAEVIGIVGTAGFIGMGVGPLFGDWLAADFEQGVPLVRQTIVIRMFLLSLLFAVVSLGAVCLAAREPPKRKATRTAPLFAVVRKYHPGIALLLAVVMGLGISFPPVFVRPLAEARDVDNIYTFFVTYAISAFAMRILTRRWPETFGLIAMIVAGFVCLAASMPLYFLVESQWDLIFPAVVAGTAHAFLFPSLIAICTQSFPDRFRGVATTLALAMFDLGTLSGAAIVGCLLPLKFRFLPAAPGPNYSLVQICFMVLFMMMVVLTLIKIRDPQAKAA